MADVTLQVVVPDAHVARIKAAAQGIFGETYTAPQLKVKIEAYAWRHIKDLAIQWEQQEASRTARTAAEDEIQL